MRFVYVHFAYIPILLGGFAFGIIGGIGTGIAAGLLLGPLMPQNTTLDLMQETHNWILRLALFVLIGGLIGTWSDALKRHLRELAWLHEHHEDTGLLNLAGLIKRLDEHMRGAPDARKLVVSITQLDNFLEIQNTFGSSFGMRVLAQVV